MLFAVYASDNENVGELRSTYYPAHKDHLDVAERFDVQILLAGPLLADDGITAVGSLFVLQAQDRESAENFNKADPFFSAGVWKNVNITVFEKRRG